MIKIDQAIIVEGKYDKINIADRFYMYRCNKFAVCNSNISVYLRQIPNSKSVTYYLHAVLASGL